MPDPSPPPSQPGVSVPEAAPETSTALCPMYKVFLHNDPVTSMVFVVRVLMNIFHLQQNTAVDVMYEAHHDGIAFVVALPFEQAEFRVARAHSLARAVGYPLTFTYEPE